MPDISTFQAEEREVTVELLGEPVTIAFTAGAFTPELEGQIAEAQSDEQMRTLARAMASFLVSWDITKDGEPFPPTYENLCQVPAELLMRVVQAISSTIAPDEAGKASPVT
jgi:hypothetical protein